MSATSCSAETVYDYESIIQYGYEQDLEFYLSAANESDYVVRAIYDICMPKSTNNLSEIILSAYGDYDAIVLIEYGIYTIPPIVQSHFCCIGISDDSYFILETPFEIVARTYDPASMDGILITRLR
jgi:hypothetical protein